MRLRRLSYRTADGLEKAIALVPAIHKEPSRSQILRYFARHPEIAYFETNVRRYTADDVYAGHNGTMI